MPPNPFLGVVKRQGEIDFPVTKIELEHGISSGAYLSAIAEGLVPAYEEQMARVERGYSLETWAGMSVDDKAMVIAIRRTTLALHNLQAEAEIRQQKKA